jgi:hypothetical protein
VPHPDKRKWYGRHWRSITRPAILRRAGGRFDEDGNYQGAAKCSKCGWIDCLPNGRSELDVAHLVIPPGEPGHDDETNLACLCHNRCHRATDLKEWSIKYRAWLIQAREERIARKDRERPIFTLLEA